MRAAHRRAVVIEPAVVGKRSGLREGRARGRKPEVEQHRMSKEGKTSVHRGSHRGLAHLVKQPNTPDIIYPPKYSSKGSIGGIGFAASVHDDVKSGVFLQVLRASTRSYER